MIKKIINRFNYFLFDSFGIPKTKNDKIALAYLKKFLPSNPTVIDCGAHDGSDTVVLQQKLGGRVYAFEVVPEIFERLKQRTANNKNIICFPIALAAETGTAKFYVGEGSSDASSSLLAPKEHLVDHPDINFDRTITVETNTLDDWAAKQGITSIDFLWLDMQGAELMMLQHSPKILATVKMIHTEVSVRETYEGVTLYKDYKNWLTANGFKLIAEAIPTG